MSAAPAFREALAFWWRLGWISFGGPAGQIAIMHAELVARRGWIDERRFVAGLNFCMLLPGPEAQQLATWLGWTLHGVRGALVAGTLFVLPAALLLWGLSWLYVAHGARAEVAGALLGLQCAVLALIAQAVVRLGTRLLRTPVAAVLALAALVVLGLRVLPFPLLVLAAGVIGALAGRWAPRALPMADEAPDGAPTATPRGRPGRAALVVGTIWVAVVALVVLAAGAASTFGEIALFFSRAALVTFGGAYAVLPYVAEHAVHGYGWLDADAMVVGLGLAETTPGPLIMVLEFVGFVAAWNDPQGLPPPLAASLGALLSVTVTFLPSFVLVLAGAPWVECINRVGTLRAALAAISAAVIGVIAHLALWFGAAVLLEDGRPRLHALLLALAMLGLLVARRIPVPVVVLAGAVAGVGLQALGLV